jgi:hypothetical protein
MTDSLTPYFILDPEDEKGICSEFLTEAVARFKEDDTVKPMLTKAVAGLSYQLSNLTMNDDYKPYVQVFPNYKLPTSGDTDIFIGFEVDGPICPISHGHCGGSSFSNGGFCA